MFYVDAGSEVRTRHDLPDALATGKRIVVPYCIVETNELELFHLESMDELVEGAYRILEPREELRTQPGKRVEVSELDLVMVPGTAFDADGGRMGQGKGYYDRLLTNARPDTPLVALAFECQIVNEIPMASHDVYMDQVITEEDITREKVVADCRDLLNVQWIWHCPCKVYSVRQRGSSHSGTKQR